jgi:DNA-binding transcriptional MerR regulator
VTDETNGSILAVSEGEASRRLGGVSRAALRSWRSQGRGPKFVKAGRRVLYRLADLEAYLDANRVETAR